MSDRGDSPPPIVLLTDFGTRDGYPGVMKGAIARIAPGVPVIDLSHEVPPQDVRSASFLLGESFRHFPDRTVHVAVVDPGVGSSRRGLALRSRGHFFVGPDNGLFTPVLDEAEVHSLDDPAYWLENVSNTFHGRDVFAPVAAHLASGVPLAALGHPVGDSVRLEFSAPLEVEGGWRGEVVYVDRFGNLVTNLTKQFVEDDVGGSCVARLGGEDTWPVRRTYSDVPTGERCSVVGGFGRLELSVNQGNAASVSGAKVGDRVFLEAIG
jgi:S-adenosyl-L-methionine hydrolase (adenosine-forming)